MRCLALAQAWQDRGGTASLTAAELPSQLSQRMSAEGVSLNEIHVTPGGLEDANETIAHARRLGADWVVVDGDHFGSDFLGTVRAAGFRVLLVDDFADRECFPADVIVNPNLDDAEGPYRARGATALVRMGLSYGMLRREFRQAEQRKEVREAGNRILITLGGSDPGNLTPKIVGALAHCSDLELTAIVGSGNDKVDELRDLSASHLRILCDPPNIAQLMRDADLAIIAAGGTLWELLSTGCAVLSYSRNRVQMHVVQELSRRGVIVDLGETRHFDPAQLVESVKELADSRLARERMATLGRGLVDGMGTTRIVEALQQSGVQGW